MINIDSINYTIENKKVIDNISCDINQGEIIGLIGSPGTGKSLLLNLIAADTKPADGIITIDSFTPKQIKKNRKTITLSHFKNNIPNNLNITVYDFILSARISFKKFFKPYSELDLQLTEKHIAQFRLEKYSDTELLHLPRAILKRVELAHVFNFNSSYILFDSPTDELDIEGIYLLRKAIIRYALNGDKIIIIASHNINFISQTVDRVLLLHQGKIAIDGSTEIINADNIKKYFNIEALMSKNIYNGKPEIHFFPDN